MNPEQDDGHAELLAAVDEMAAAMKAKLEANRHKGGRIEDAGQDWLLDRLREECAELIDAARAWNWQWGDGAARVDAIRDEAADVSNFALFVWVAARRIESWLTREFSRS